MTTRARGRAVAFLMAALAIAAAPGATGSAYAASAATSQAAGPARVDYSGVVTTLNTEVEKLMSDADVVGVTLTLIDGDRIILRRGYGYADRAAKHKVTIDTLFHIGSISKTFTATAVMQLVERGLVDLDAPLTRYVPQLKLQPRYANNVITVRSVLDHHSGIPGDVYNGLITVRRPDPGFGDFLLGALAQMPPERPVDTEWAYNNSGYVLLQNLVENVTGQSFLDYTRQHLFDPLAMPRSTYDDTSVPASALTRNYTPKLSESGSVVGPVGPAPREYVNGWAAGSIVSSARDMTNYLRMVVGAGQGVKGRVVTSDTFREMRTAQTHLPIDLQAAEGLGWSLSSAAVSGVGPSIYHDGATGYNFSTVVALPDTKLAVFVSTNTVGGADVATGVANRALELAYQAKTGHAVAPDVSLPDTRVDATDAELLKVAGRYATSTGYDRVDFDSGYLLWTHNAQSASPDDPSATISYAPTMDGWWTSTDTPDLQLGFRNLGGKRLMLVRLGGSPAFRYYVVGQYAVVQNVSPDWSLRFGTYQAVDRNPDSAPLLVPRRIIIGAQDGLVLMSSPGVGTTVLRPLEKDRAFTFGTGLELGRGKGDVVAFNGLRFTYMGVTYERISS